MPEFSFQEVNLSKNNSCFITQFTTHTSVEDGLDNDRGQNDIIPNPIIKVEPKHEWLKCEFFVAV